MPLPIEDYGLIGDCETAALVGRDGSIDWLCVPRFDSGACFAALLGGPEHGRWLLAPAGATRAVRRRYRGDTLVLETEFETDDGVVAVIDFMPIRTAAIDLVRLVEGRRGRVKLRTELVFRLDYGERVPWVQHAPDGLTAVAGPDRFRLRGPVALRGEDFRSVGEFEVAAGQRLAFDLTWFPSHLAPPPAIDPVAALADTEAYWQAWVARGDVRGPWRDAEVRSLVTLKALTYAPTGGIVAAPTTSLPEQLGGVRNWDYRYCWLRDATFTLLALLEAGYVDEARAWREWLLRAAAGVPAQLRIMYGLAGEHHLTELEVPWLPGYEGARPVRIGNGAHTQRQLDVFGEVLDVDYQSLRAGLAPDGDGWRLARELLAFLESAWTEPDEGIWEVRGPRRHFTHSKVMAWVAFDRAVKSVEVAGLDGPLAHWRGLRARIHAEICREGFDARRGAFVQSYGSDRLDASLLMIPLVGFLPPEDPRVRGTVAAIERELVADGFVLRYRDAQDVDGLPPGEGAFLLCTFWLADNLALMGRRDEARAVFERLLAARNDLGLLAEGYDPRARRLVGNFPQAFSHVGLLNTARNLTRAHGPAETRRADQEPVVGAGAGAGARR